MIAPTVEQVKRDLRGPAMPIVTMLKDDLSLDLDATQDNVRFLLDGGIAAGSGIMLVGGAGGDFPMLSLEERKDLAQAVVEAADGIAPVLIGGQDTDMRAILALAEHGRKIGAYGIQISPAYYFDSSDDDVIAFFRTINDAISIPIMVYHTHWLGFTMSFAVLDALADLEWVLGLKWSHPSSFYFMRGVERYADRLAIVDNALMQVPSHMLGAVGFITHLANIWPQHEMALWKQLERGDYVAAMAEIGRVNWRWYEFRGKMGAFSGGESHVVKAAYELIGRRGGPSRPPMRALTDEHRVELKALLKEIGVPGVRG